MTQQTEIPLSWLPRWLAALTRLVITQPRTTGLWIVVSCVLSLALTLLKLEFKTDRADLIDRRAEFHQRWLKFAEEFGETSDLIVVVEHNDPTRVHAAMDQIGAELESLSDDFHRVQWKLDPRILRSRGLQFLPPALLDVAVSRTRPFAPILKEGRWERATLASYSQGLARHLSESVQRGDQRGIHDDLEQITRLSGSLLGFLQSPEDFQSPWSEPIPREVAGTFGDIPAKVHYYGPHETMGFVLAVPKKGTDNFSGKSPSLDIARRLVSEWRMNHPDVQIGLTGIPVLEADEMAKSQEDMGLASAISCGGVLLLLLIGFRSLRHPLISMVMLLVGILWSLCLTTLVIGHLNILSVSFATILIGLGIDFAIHFLERYLQLRHEGVPLEEALVKTSATTGAGIATCAVTTAAAFYCAGFTSFLGVAELGIIAGGGVLLCALAAFVVLPPLVCLSDREIQASRLPHAFAGRSLQRLIRSAPGFVTILSLALLLASVACGIGKQEGRYVSRVKYDANLLNLQARGIESVELQHHIFDQGEGSLLYAVSVAQSADEVRQRREQFLKLPTVAKVEELGSLIPRFPHAETEVYIVQLKQLLSQIEPPPAEPAIVDPAEVGTALLSLQTTLAPITTPTAQTAAMQLQGFIQAMRAIPPQQQVPLLTGYQHAMQMALHLQFAKLAEVTETRSALEALPPAMRSRFVSPQGNWLLRIFPKTQIWDEAPLAAFVQDIRSIDPDATGTPLQNYEAAQQIRDSYGMAAVLAATVIVFVLLIDLLRRGPLLISLLAPAFVVGLAWNSPAAWDRLGGVGIAVLYIGMVFAVALIFDWKNAAHALLAMAPPMAGGILTFGGLALLKTDLNPANMIVLPLLLGIGVDSGVYVLHDYRSQTRGQYMLSAVTMNSLILTSLTTMVGFGSMIISSHQGLASLGLVLTLGVGNCLFVAIVVLPAFLTLLDQRQHAQTAPAIPPGEPTPIPETR